MIYAHIFFAAVLKTNLTYAFVPFVYELSVYFFCFRSVFYQSTTFISLGLIPIAMLFIIFLNHCFPFCRIILAPLCNICTSARTRTFYISRAPSRSGNTIRCTRLFNMILTIYFCACTKIWISTLTFFLLYTATFFAMARISTVLITCFVKRIMGLVRMTGCTLQSIIGCRWISTLTWHSGNLSSQRCMGRWWQSRLPDVATFQPYPSIGPSSAICIVPWISAQRNHL